MCSHDDASAAVASKVDLLAPPPPLITEFPHLSEHRASSVLIAQFHSPIIKFVLPAHPSGPFPPFLGADEIESQIDKLKFNIALCH